MIIEISVAVIAVAFIALVIYVIFLINALRTTLKRVDRTIEEVQKKIEEVGPQAHKAIEHTNQLTFDIKRKMESLNPIFNMLSNVGEILEHKTFILKKESFNSLHKENKSSEDFSLKERDSSIHEDINVADILELAGIGIRLWQKLKNKHSLMAKTKEKENIP